jgi:hypothetical protein
MPATSRLSMLVALSCNNYFASMRQDSNERTKIPKW